MLPESIVMGLGPVSLGVSWDLWSTAANLKAGSVVFGLALEWAMTLGLWELAWSFSLLGSAWCWGYPGTTRSTRRPGPQGASLKVWSSGYLFCKEQPGTGAGQEPLFPKFGLEAGSTGSLCYGGLWVTVQKSHSGGWFLGATLAVGQVLRLNFSGPTWHWGQSGA